GRGRRAMDTAFKVAARLVMALAASASGVMVQPQTHAQAQPEAHEKPPCDCAELTEAEGRLEGQAKRLNDWPDLARYREANARVAAPAKDEQRVVFMCDSITDLWVQPQFGGFFPGKPYIGRGISGQTTPQMFLRFRADVIALRPKVVVILAGTNDIAGNTGPMTNEEIEGNLASMSELAHAHNIKVVMASVTPISAYHVGPPPAVPQTTSRPMARIRALNDWINRDRSMVQGQHAYGHAQQRRRLYAGRRGALVPRARVPVSRSHRSQFPDERRRPQRAARRRRAVRGDQRRGGQRPLRRKTDSHQR